MHLCASRSSGLLLAKICYDQPSGFMFVHKTFLGTRMHVCAYTQKRAHNSSHCLLISQGEEGAKEVLQMLKEEFRLAMALTGGTLTFPL